MNKVYEVVALAVSRSNNQTDVIAKIDTFDSREKADAFVSARRENATPFQKAVIDYRVNEVIVK
jgi:hypothetical protein